MKNRDNIYYWKCDRPERMQTLKVTGETDLSALREQVRTLCAGFFGDSEFIVGNSCGQGNHKNFIISRRGVDYFIRIEDGDDGDGYMLVETEVIRRVGELGVPTPEIYAVDVTRKKFPFAYQLMEKFTDADINRIYKEGNLNTPAVMRQLGGYIASWQTMTTSGFGPFNTVELAETGRLVALHKTYPEYYMLNLDRHLDYLVSEKFIPESASEQIRKAVRSAADCLEIDCGCLVHKDIAFWNLIGRPDSIVSVIDWDDTIMGDPTDDLSLMACYHSWAELEPLFEGYTSVRPLPEQFGKRFWLHLLRNMIFKAVIRVGAGYFSRRNDFFLVPSDKNGDNNLKEITLSRLESAVRGLEGTFKIQDLK
ncbi:MAG: phosphotransferase family protein [Candidatus Cryptobacteroides sp.]